RTVPGSSSPETIASSITSAMSSALVLSRLTRRVYVASSRVELARRRLLEVPRGPLELVLGLRPQRAGLLDEPPSRAAGRSKLVQRVSFGEDRLPGLSPDLVLRHRERHPLLALNGTALAEEAPRLLVALGEVEPLDGHPHLTVHVRTRRGALGLPVHQRTHPVVWPPAEDTPAARSDGRALLVVVVALADLGAGQQVVPVADLGNADRLLAALALDRCGHRYFATPVLFPQRIDSERAADARARGNGRREA